MFKGASESEANQRVQRQHGIGPAVALAYVVAFHRSPGNGPVVRPVRRVWTAPNVRKARDLYDGLGPKWLYVVLFGADGARLDERGDPALAQEWETRRQAVNAGQDWSTANTYHEREAGTYETAVEEADSRAQMRFELPELIDVFVARRRAEKATKAPVPRKPARPYSTGPRASRM
jgi:hypothetical protein